MSASESVTPRLYVETRAPSRTEAQVGSTRLFQSMLAAIEVAIDFLTCACGIFWAYLLDPSQYLGGKIQYPLREATAVGLGVSIFAVLLLHRNGAYRGGGGLLQIRETERAIRIPVQSLLVMLPFCLLLNLKFSRAAFLIALVLIPISLILQKHLFIAVVRGLHGMGCGVDRVIVYGIGGTGKRILSALSHSVRLGLYPVAVIAENAALDGEWMLEMGYRRPRSVPVKRGPITPALLNSCHCSTLIVALPNLSSKQIQAAVDAAKQARSRIVFLSATELQEQKWTESVDVDGLSLAPMLESFDRWHYSIAKRMADLIGSSLLLVLLAPLFFLIALFIRLDSTGPAFSCRTEWAATESSSRCISFVRCTKARRNTSSRRPHRSILGLPGLEDFSGRAAWMNCLN